MIDPQTERSRLDPLEHVFWIGDLRVTMVIGVDWRIWHHIGLPPIPTACVWARLGAETFRQNHDTGDRCA
jgi:hypothetical protein